MNRIALMILRNLPVVLGLWLRLCRYANHTDRYPEAERWAHIQKIMKRAVRSGNVELVCTGLENLPREPGYLLVGNHQGLFDVVAIAATHDMPLGSVYKKELEGKPFVRQIADCTGSFAMNREDVRQSLTVIQAVTQQLLARRSYLIFPEGTRSRRGNQMNEFHGGSFRCAVKAKAPIVPFAVIDSFRVLDQKGSRPVRVQLHYLEPIPYEAYQGMKTTEIARMVQGRIAQAMDAHTPSVREEAK